MIIYREMTISFLGNLTISENPLRIYNKLGSLKTIYKIFLSVDTAPVGASIIVDIHKNGATIFNEQSYRPVIAESSNTGYSMNIDSPTWIDGEYLTAYIDQVGSIIPGANMVVHIVYS